MKCFICLLLGLFALIGLQSCESNKRANNYNNKALVDDSGMLFLKNGAEASLATVKASGLAISNSKNQQVIQFAKSMIDDHTLLADNFKKLEIDNFVTSNDTVNAVHQQVITALAQKKAAEFDKAYMELVVNEHEQQVALFKTAVLNKNSNVSDFARKAVPSLQAHLDSAKMIMMALK
jgi:putative membrane protein